ncbi:MAG: hypothetical protein AAF390_11415 [Pseudomonadota bacterium]
MPIRHALALIAMLAAAPAAAQQDPIDISPDFDPTIVWFDAPRVTLGASGRVRLVFADGLADAALDLNQYYFYQLQYREALAHFTMRAPLTRADPLARRHAFIATLRQFPEVQKDVRGAVLTEIDESLRLVPAPQILPGGLLPGQ